MDPYKRGHRDGIRWAITWLHERGKEMNDPHAKAVLDSAAFNMGNEGKRVAPIDCEQTTK